MARVISVSKKKEIEGYRVHLIPLEDLSVSEDNVRKINADARLEDLMSSIEAFGVKDPAIVINGGIIHGQRRWLACKKLVELGITKATNGVDLTKLPCTIEENQEKAKNVILSLILNMLQERPNSLDTKKAVEYLVSVYKTLPEASKASGISPHTLKYWVIGRDRPAEVQKALEGETPRRRQVVTQIERNLNVENDPVKGVEIVTQAKDMTLRGLEQTAVQASRGVKVDIKKAAEDDKKRKLGGEFIIPISLSNDLMDKLTPCLNKRNITLKEAIWEGLTLWLEKETVS